MQNNIYNTKKKLHGRNNTLTNDPGSLLNPINEQRKRMNMHNKNHIRSTIGLNKIYNHKKKKSKIEPVFNRKKKPQTNDPGSLLNPINEQRKRTNMQNKTQIRSPIPWKKRNNHKNNSKIESLFNPKNRNDSRKPNQRPTQTPNQILSLPSALTIPQHRPNENPRLPL